MDIKLVEYGHVTDSKGKRKIIQSDRYVPVCPVHAKIRSGPPPNNKAFLKRQADNAKAWKNLQEKLC